MADLDEEDRGGAGSARARESEARSHRGRGHLGSVKALLASHGLVVVECDKRRGSASSSPAEYMLTREVVVVGGGGGGAARTLPQWLRRRTSWPPGLSMISCRHWVACSVTTSTGCVGCSEIICRVGATIRTSQADSVARAMSQTTQVRTTTALLQRESAPSPRDSDRNGTRCCRPRTCRWAL